MKMRLLSVGLGAGAAIALGAVWADSAQAFSLHSTVVVENFLRVETLVEGEPTLRDIPFQEPTIAEVVRVRPSPLLSQRRGQSSGNNKPDIDISPNGDNQEPSLMQFGGIWDIYLYGNSVWFDLNSRFGNVTSGQDVYVFLAPDLDGSIQKIVATSTGKSPFEQSPVVNLLKRNKFEVVFPLGFAPGDSPNLTAIPGDLRLQIDLVVDPTPVPSPALLPGLIGMALAALCQRRNDYSQASLSDDEAASGERAI